MVGTIRIQSAKNACLPIIAATILTKGKTILRNVPKISDIDNLLFILSGLGCRVQWKDGDLYIDTTNISYNEIDAEVAKKIRGSIFVLGCLVARFKQARLPYPGGCAIGARPIDIHVEGFKKIGIKVREARDYIDCSAKRIKGGVVYLDFPSVGATENIIMAAALGNTTTTIINAAKEPEVTDLVRFLRSCGACINGEGTDTITVAGVKELQGVDYIPIPDRINTASYMLAVATVGGNVVLENVIAEHNANLIEKLKADGCKIETKNNNLQIIKDKNQITRKRNTSMQTSPYPGFSTDIQNQYMVYRSTVSGLTTITENLFENRYSIVPQLQKLGATICVKNRVATVTGGSELTGGTCENPMIVIPNDLRGGVGLVIAALASRGVTIVERADLVKRGHESIERDLGNLGANIILKVQ